MRRPSRSLLAGLALILGTLPAAAQDGVGSLTEYSAMVQVDHLWVDHGTTTPEGVTLRLSRWLMSVWLWGAERMSHVSPPMSA